MKSSVVVFLMLFLIVPNAISCEVREYAQIKEMDVPTLERLLKEYSQLRDIKLKYYQDMIDSKLRPSPKIERELNICIQEIDKVDQVLKTKRSEANKNLSNSSDAIEQQEQLATPNTQIYRSEDSNGTLVFSDNPSTQQSKKYKKRNNK